MNKIKKIISIAMLCGVLLSGCSKAQPETATTAAEQPVKETVAENLARTVEVNYGEHNAYFTFNEKGLLISEENKPYGAYDTLYSYDEENRLTEIVYKHDTKRTYEYDPDGKLVKCCVYDLIDNQLKEICEYEYTDKRLAKIYIYNNKNGEKVLFYHDEFVYEETENGVTVISKNISFDGTTGEAISVYDKNGRLIAEEYPSGAGSTEYIYDESGKLIKEIYGNNEQELAYEYKDGVPVKATWVKDDFSGSFGSYREFRYYDNGNIKATFWCTPSGDVEEITIEAVPEVKGNFAEIYMF